ncbi:MAG: tetratricopeptide repeat protein [Proteobacteria bacterium]|nr:tetratricopeptide repeat protein [Pseudomonadota bacterium]
MLFELCLTLGVSMIATATTLGIVRGRQNTAGRSKGRGNRRLAAGEHSGDSVLRVRRDTSEPWLNIETFGGMPEGVAEPLADEDWDVGRLFENADAQPDPMATPKATMTLASLIEVQRIEALESRQRSAFAERVQFSLARPRILGDAGCELGVRYFEYLLANHVVPRGNVSATNESNLIIAENALKNGMQSATLSHGAVAQRIGERALCIFEPLEMAVENVDRAIEAIAELVKDKTVFFVLANTDRADEKALAHVAPICAQYGIPKLNLFIEQPDGAFANYFEDMRDFVPGRIDVRLMPEQFFSDLLDYAHDAYDEGDNETVMRVLAPIVWPVHERTLQTAFSKVLSAQALNLIGMTHRDLGQDEAAVHCFEASLDLLRAAEDYEAIKSVKANLGITLALIRPATLPVIESAIRHLHEVTQLNPRDDEAWVYLANTYLEQFRFTSGQSLLRRALRAYEKAYALAPTHEVAACMEALVRQLGPTRAQDKPQSPENPTPCLPYPRSGDRRPIHAGG